jgi:hypothetical protein
MSHNFKKPSRKARSVDLGTQGCLFCGAQMVSCGAIYYPNDDIAKQFRVREVTYVLCEKCAIGPDVSNRAEEVIHRKLTVH